MKAPPDDQQAVAAIVPYTFEQSLLYWAEALEADAECAESLGVRRRVVLLPAHAKSIAKHLRGAVRLLGTEGNVG